MDEPVKEAFSDLFPDGYYTELLETATGKNL